MPCPPSDVFRPRLPLDPFAAVDVRAPWLVPHSLPHSPPQVVLVLGEPPASELLPLLTSPHLARSLLLLASHAPPALPLLPPTIPGPAVRILRLPAPLAVHDAGALRLVALLEKAHRVAARWRQASPSGATHAHAYAASSLPSFQPLGASSWAAGPGKAPAWSGVASGSAADRVVQLAEAPKTGEFVVVEPVVYLPPPQTQAVSSAAADPLYHGSTAAGVGGLAAGAQGSSADSRRLSSYNNIHHHHRAGSSAAPPRPSPLPTSGNATSAPQNHQHQQHLRQQQEVRYPSPAPSVAESLSSASHSTAIGGHPKKDGLSSLPSSTSSSLPSSASSASTLAAPDTSLKTGNNKKSNSKRFSTLSLSSPSPMASPDVSPMPSPVGPSSSQSLAFLSASPSSTSNSKKLRKSIRSTYSSSSLSLSFSSSTSRSKEISPFAASVNVKSKGTSKNKGTTHTGTERAFDAILNFLPQGVPDKQLLKHAILVTTLGARYLEGEGGSAGAGHGHVTNHGSFSGHDFAMVDSPGRSSASASSSLTRHHAADAGYVSDTGTIHDNKRVSRRFSAFSVFSFASTSVVTPPTSVPSTPRSTPDLLGVTPASSRPGSAGSARSVSLAPTSAHGHQGCTPGSSLRARPQSAYSASAYGGSADAHGEENTDGEVDADTEVEVEARSVKEKEEQKKRKSVRKRISAFLGGNAAGASGGGGVEGREREQGGMETRMMREGELRRPDMVRCGEGSRAGSVYGVEGDVEEAMGGKAKRASFFGGGVRSGHGGRGRETQVMTAHIVHVLPAGWVDWEYSASPATSRRNSSNLGVEMLRTREEYGKGIGKGKPKPKLVQSVEQFLLSFAYPLGSLGGAGYGSGSGTSIGKESSGRPLRPPPSAYPGGRSSSLGAVELQQHYHEQSQQQPNEGRLAALARQHRPVPYLVAPGVFGAVISYSASSSGDGYQQHHLLLPHAFGHNARQAVHPTDSGHGHGHGHAYTRTLTHGEAILLGALDVDPASGSRAGTGRAWVGVGDVRFVEAPVNEALPPVPALPAAVLASSRFQPQASVVHQLDGKVKATEEKKPTTLVGRSPDVQLPTPPESGSSSGESIEGEDGEDDVEAEEEEATEKEVEKQKEGAQDGERDLPPRAAVAPHRTISNASSSKSNTPSKTSSDLQSQSDTHAPTSGLQRRLTRNHRPAPPPPSVPSPVRAALESLSLSPADPAPPPWVIALPETEASANPTTKAAFPAMKEGAVEAMTEDLTPPARPRTIHVSDAHRSPPVPVGVNLNRSASQSTSALLRGGPKEREREREKNGHGKGYAHGFQAAWRRLVVWRGREKGAQKA